MVARYEFKHDNPFLLRLQEAITPERDTVLTHPIYSAIATIDDAAWFMENHVFAVWDFMSLLKTLQASLTCVTVPWLPRGSAATRRLVNEIVLVEESDEFADEYLSHFELYLLAMEDAGANRSAIRAFLAAARSGTPVESALTAARVPPAARAFVDATWKVLCGSPLYCQAAAFAFGREDLIPEMFGHILGIEDPGERLTRFKLYLGRHIDVDADTHSPMAMQMLIDLCGEDNTRWDECTDTVRHVFAARTALWHGICAGLPRRS